MYTLHETHVYMKFKWIQFLRDLQKCYILVRYFYKWHAYMYKCLINYNKNIYLKLNHVIFICIIIVKTFTLNFLK